jgi:hypothetical protein
MARYEGLAHEPEDLAESTRSFEALLGILREWDEAEHMKNKLVNEGIPAAPLAESAEHP